MFEGKEDRTWVVTTKVINSFKGMFKEKVQKGKRKDRPPQFNLNMPLGMFDSTSQENGEICWDHIVLKPLDNTIYKIRLGCLKGINIKGELMDLCYLLYFDHVECISHLQIVGDSKIIIAWLSKKHRLHVVILKASKQKVEQLVTQFTILDSQHIYIEQNTKANDISKQDLHLKEGTLHIQEYKKCSLLSILQFTLF